MSFVLYNTHKKAKVAFEPIDPARVTMYVCGPTVYNRIHIGNARPAVVFDTLFRILRQRYPLVVYARNITDIDDKIMAAAKDEGVDIAVISERFTQAYLEDVTALGNLEPTIMPKATEHLAGMIEVMEKLIASGHAYEADGHVLCAVSNIPNYGSLSHRSIDDMLAGARVEVADYKKHPADFVLWKPSSDEEPGWPSPWGRGRPGWHTECVAMIQEHLGDAIDIHGGGRDLIFPHHENELAQSNCTHNGGTFVNYWMHNGYINFDGLKMSKSIGNVKLVNELLEHYRGEVLRYGILSAHYRSDMDYSFDLLDQAKASLNALYTALRDVEDVDITGVDAELETTEAYQALLDDLNTPIALSGLHQLAKALNKADAADKPKYKAQLIAAGELMGLLQEAPQQWFQQADSANAISEADIEALIAERDQAKLDKNYQRADDIRESLKTQGVLLEDSREGTTWKRA